MAWGDQLSVTMMRVESLSWFAAGKAKYDSKKHALVWKVKRFNGATEHSLMASVELIATTRDKKAWSRPPISMSFQVCIPPPKLCLT